MTDFQLQELQPEHTSVPAGRETTITPPPTPAKKSNRNVFLTIIGALLVGSCCISACVGIVGLMGTGVARVLTEKPEVENVIDGYLSSMDSQDAGQAYTLISTRAKRNVLLADIEKCLEGNNYKVFEGYREIALTNFTLGLASDSDPDMPQGLVAEVDGVISYADGFIGDFTAVLEQDGEEWRLFSINVNVPPDKFDP
jgi:hypothetical protein